MLSGFDAGSNAVVITTLLLCLSLLPPHPLSATSSGVWFWKLRYRIVLWYRGGLVFKVHRRLHHSTLGVRVIKKQKEQTLRVGSFQLSSLARGMVWLENQRREIHCKTNRWP